MEQNDNLLLKLMDGFPDCIIVTDSASGSIVYKNQKAEDFFPNDAQRKNNCSPPCPLLMQVSDVAAVSLSEPMELACCNNQRILRVHSYLLEWNGLPAYVHIFTDAAQAGEISQSADCLDSLTQTYDRRFCYLTMEDWTFSLSTFTVCFLDIDNLNEININFGSETGDEYMRAVTQQVKQHLSPQDCLCRLGGDEFVLLSPIPCEQEMTLMMETVRTGLRCLSTSYLMSFSYGIIEVEPDSSLTPDEILEYASCMMYEYKQQHKKVERT